MQMRDLIKLVEMFDDTLEPENAPELLYHGTSIPAAITILRTNKLKAKQASSIEAAAVSFTSDPKIAHNFGEDRDGRALRAVNMKRQGYKLKDVKWATDNYSGRDNGLGGVVLVFDGPKLAETGASLTPYEHYGMQEDEYRSEWDIDSVSEYLVAIHVNPKDIETWAEAVPEKAKAIRALLNHPKAKPAQ